MIASSPVTGFRAFISYSHADSRAARWLHHALETYRVPKALRQRDGLDARLGRFFLDRSELPTSTDLAATIQDALRQSENLIVICSPRAAASRWVNQEIEFFASLGRADRVFCLVVDGDAGSVEESPFPLSLFKGLPPGVEPLAADWRPGQDGRSDAKLKIIAGLLDVRFDDLRQREARRRQRRWVIAAAIGTTLMLVMLGLTINAVIARNEADRQRQTAERTSEFLRTLFRNSDPNAARGRDITAREILNQGVKDLSAPGELSDQPKVHAALLTTLAEVFANLGLYDDAARLADQSRKLPGQDGPQLARSLRLLGELAMFKSDYERAETLLQRALTLAVDDPATQLNALINLGEVYKSVGRYAEAEAMLTRAATLAHNQSPPDKDNEIRALASMGGTDFEAGNYDRAAVRLNQVVVQRTKLSGPLHPEVAFALNTLGTVASKRGDRIGAARYFNAALTRQRRVLGDDHFDVAVTKANLARALVENSQFSEAAALVEKAIAAVLRTTDGSVDSLANMYDTLGLAQGGLGRVADARSSFDKAARIAGKYQMAKEGEVLGDLAELECMNGNVPLGLQRLANAREAYARTQSTEGWRAARLNSIQARCLLRSGKAGEAARISAGSGPPIVARWGSGSLFDMRNRTP